jgi:hypothetical protein
MKAFQNFYVSIGLTVAVGFLVVVWLFGKESERNAVDSVRYIYSELYYENSKLSSLDKVEDIYSSALSTLIKQERQLQLVEGEIGKLSADPLCNCQDPASVEIVAINPIVTSETNTSVQAVLLVSGVSHRLSLDLVKESEGWRVADVTSDQMPSLFEFLNQR